MPTPPRKRAPRALKAVPDRPPVEALREEPARLGKNKARIEAQKALHSGPDMAPGVYLPHLPTAEEVPPKPKEEPKMDYPGIGYHRGGHPEWQLHTTFAEDDPLKAVHREWRVRWVPPEENRCTARGIGKASQWQGNRCTQRRIKGARVCNMHGGKIPNVKKAAQAALALASLPAAEELIRIALKKRGVSDADRIKAIIQILDRAGVSGQQTVQVELSLWQKTLQDVYANNLASPGDDVPGRELEEGVDFELEDDEEASNGDGE